METRNDIATCMRRATAALLLFAATVGACGPLWGQEFKGADRRNYEEALTLYEKGDYHQAAVLLRKVASHNPKAAEPQFWLGMTAVNDGFNTAGIRKYFSRCIELAPDYPNALAHYYMGVIHYTDKRYDEAVGELERYFALAEGSEEKATMAAYEEASNYLYWSQFLAAAELNAAPFEPERVAGVSSRRDEILPTLSPDGTTFYYLRKVPVKRERTYYARELEETRWQLYSSRWTDTAYSAGTPLPAPFNSGRPEGGVTVTADGRELYYSVITDSRGYANSDIYRVEKRDGRWGEPEVLGRHVNDPNTWESQPTVSADGRVLVFASNRRGGVGGTDLWKCRRLANGDWSRPENLGPNVNTAGNEKMPFLAADGHTLYFLSDGWQGFGGYDIYFADLDDRFGNRPTNLGLPINTETDESGFGVTADGRRAYFAGRLDDSRSTDILMFDLYPAARPEPMRLCRMTVGTASGGHDTLLVLGERRPTTVTLSAEGMLPAIVSGTARELDGRTVRLDDSVSAMALGDTAVVEALAAWLVEHPMVHLMIEGPRRADARDACERLRAMGIRQDRVLYRGGTEYKRQQIRLL